MKVQNLICEEDIGGDEERMLKRHSYQSSRDRNGSSWLDSFAIYIFTLSVLQPHHFVGIFLSLFGLCKKLFA